MGSLLFASENFYLLFVQIRSLKITENLLNNIENYD